MSEEEDDCLYDRLIEPNRLRIVKYFDPYVVFDIMRQEGVITMDDQERIQNMYPPTRRARAGQFLDILQTKGDNGVQKYINVLEYDYPHVYKLITNKDAKDPPRGFKQNRESLRSKWIDRLGEFVDVIKNQCSDNTNLKEQLEDVKAVVNLNQENIQASENENNGLREQLRMISEENRAFREQNGNLLRERDRLKDDNLRIQRDCLEYFKEKDHYKDKLNIVQQEKEHLEQETRTLTTVINQLKVELTHNHRDSARAEKKVEQIQNKLRQINDEKDCVVQLETQKHILNDALAEAQVKAEELAEDMDNLRIELDRSQGECHKIKEKLEKEKRERIMIEEWLNEKTRKIENYFERIGELEKDKQNLECERNREQQKNKELDEKYSKLFNAKHQQEQLIDSLKLEVQELRLQMRKSLEYPSDSSFPPDGSTTSSEPTDDLADYIQLETAREILPWKIEDYTCRPISVHEPINRSWSLKESRDKWTVKMKMPLLDKINITGGNFTGIFVDKVLKKMDKMVDAPKPGDRIESISRITKDYCQQDITSLDGFTQYQAKERLSYRHDTGDMEVTFRRIMINNIPEYECVTQWMADTTKNSRKGDYFYVRANMACNTDVSAAKHRIQTGDIFLVQDTCPSFIGEWQALKFDKKRGHWEPLCKSIPESAHNRRQAMVRQQSSDNLPGRKMAVKKRNLYTNVFPMKATSKLPVWMVGPKDVIGAVQNLMCKHHPALFEMADMSNFTQIISTVKTQNKHVLVHVNTHSWTHRIGILLLFNVQTKDQNKLGQIFHKHINLDTTAINEERLKQQGIDLKEIIIPTYEIKSEDTLVQTVCETIDEMQRRILWLCDKTLMKYKPEILQQYKCFFTENNVTSLYSRYNSSVEEQENILETSSGSGRCEFLRGCEGTRIGKERDFCNSWLDVPAEKDC